MKFFAWVLAMKFCKYKLACNLCIKMTMPANHQHLMRDYALIYNFVTAPQLYFVVRICNLVWVVFLGNIHLECLYGHRLELIMDTTNW